MEQGGIALGSGFRKVVLLDMGLTLVAWDVGSWTGVRSGAWLERGLAGAECLQLPTSWSELSLCAAAAPSRRWASPRLSFTGML